MGLQEVFCKILDTDTYEGLDKIDRERISAYLACGYTLLLDSNGHVYAVTDAKWIADAKLKDGSHV